MRILITNDDGWQATGIVTLAEKLSKKAEVVIVAPDHNRSASSNSLTIGKPISVLHGEAGRHCVYGTPADSVHIALTALLPWKPDLVVSGINQGQNLGEDTIYSGTVAAATEGFLYGIPAISFSQVDPGWEHIDSAAQVAEDLIFRIYGKLSAPWLINVNIPNKPYEALRRYCVTRLGRRYPSPGVIPEMVEDGKEAYRIGPYGVIMDNQEGTDFYAIQKGWVSLTPLQIDWTHYAEMSSLAEILL